MVAARNAPSARRLAALGVSLSFAGFLLTSAAWWCWHGYAGWGPRLLVPAVPLLAPLAAVWLVDRGAWPTRIAIGGSLLLNLPPLLAHPTRVVALTGSCRAALSAAEAAGYPGGALVSLPDGTPSVDANHVLASVPSAAPHVVYPWFAWATFAPSPLETAARLAAPPWNSSRPGLVPLLADPTRDVAAMAPRFEWGWGRSFWRRSSSPAVSPLYTRALWNLIRRRLAEPVGQDLIDLSVRLRLLAGEGDADAYCLEALRLSRRPESAADFAAGLRPSARRWPLTSAALALLERDAGRPASAGAAMATAGRGDPTGRYAGFSTADPASWPTDLLPLSGRRWGDEALDRAGRDRAR